MATSCQKENSPEPENYTKFEADVINLPVSVENNTLAFDTEQDFQKCLDLLKNADLKQLVEFEKTLNFSSYRTQHQESIDENDPNFSDELFLSIINPDAEIIIARHLFRVDFDNEKTIVSPINNNNSLKSGSSITFDWDEDIFEYIETGQRNLLKTSYCTGNKEKEEDMGWGQSGYNFTIKTKVVFQRVGFYNSIIIKMKTIEYSIDFEIDSWYDTMGSNYYRKKKGGNQYFSRHNSISFNGNLQEISSRPYGPSTKRLKEYRVDVKFQISYLYNNINYTDNRTLLIECHK